MATLWIREYVNAAGSHEIAQEPGVDQTPVTYTTSVQSAAFGTAVRFIAIISDAAFHYVTGANPTATTGALKVPANTLLFIGVVPAHKIAAILAA